MMSRILVDAGRRIVYTQAVNPLRVARVRDHRERLHNDARFDPEFDRILLFKVSMRSRSRRRIYAHSRLQKVFSATSRRAFIIPMAALFGLGRMFAAYRDLAGESQINIVRSLIDAAEWVGIDLNVAPQAFTTLTSAMPSPLES
jgi:hypothetical protein